MIRTIRYSTRIANPGKVKIIQEAYDQALKLKNQMSQFCYEHLEEIGRTPKLKFVSAHYKRFVQPDSLLSAWEHQCMLQQIYSFYRTYLDAKLKRVRLHIQKGMKITRYKQAYKDHMKGDIKQVSLTYRVPSKDLVAIIKYLIYIPMDIQDLDPCAEPSAFRIDLPQWISSDVMTLFASYPLRKQQHILKLVCAIKKRILGSMRSIIFKTGSYTKLTHWTSIKDVLFFQKDDTNKRFKYWYKYTLPGRSIWLPLQINKKYHPRGFSSKECVVTVRDNMITIFSPMEIKDPIFKEPVNIEGVDLNLKHNFCCLSNGQEFDYDRDYLHKLSKQIKKLDHMQSDPSKEDLRTRRLAHLCRHNEAYIRWMIHNILDYCEDYQITDLVLEDLGRFKATFIKDADLDEKFSRLTQLLRLGSVKTWFLQQAEKRGIRVHTTPSCYTSQMCPICGNIDPANRPTQEEFVCTRCGHHDNADHNAAINIRNRFTLDVLRDNKELHVVDSYGRLQARKIGYRSRGIVLDLLAQVKPTPQNELSLGSLIL